MKLINSIKNNFLNEQTDPHKPFFLTAFIGGFFGIMLWLFEKGNMSLLWHPEIMVTNYLLPIAAGFLLVSIPKFLGSIPTKPIDRILFFSLFWVLLILAVLQKKEIYYIVKLFLLLYFGLYLIIRYVKKKGMVPYFFPFVIFAFLLALSGTVVQNLYYQSIIVDAQLLFVIKKIYFHGFFWVLFSGVASKFLPMLMGVAPKPAPKDKKFYINPFSLNVWYIVSALLVSTYVLESFGMITEGVILRAFVVFFIAYKGWHLFEKTKQKSTLGLLIKIILWHALAGHLLIAAFPKHVVHLAHIIFVGAFSTGSLIVMTRVYLGHAGISFEMEKQSKLYLAAIIILIIALHTRVSSFVLKTYERHLEMASLTWGVAIILWIIAITHWFKSHKKKAGA